MDENDLLKFTYYNNLYKVFDKTVLNIDKYGVQAACSMIGGNTPQTVPKTYNLYEYIEEFPDNICWFENLRGNVESYQLIVDEEEAKEKEKSHVDVETKYEPYDTFIFPKDKKYFIMYFDINYKINDEDEMIKSDWSIGLSNKNNLSWLNGYTGVWMESLTMHRYPTAPVENFKQETMWFGEMNYCAKVQSPYIQQPTFAGTKIYSDYINLKDPNDIRTNFLIFGDRYNNKLYNACLWGPDHDVYEGRTINSPIDLNQDLYLTMGVVWPNNLYNTEFWMEITPQNLSTDAFETYLKKIDIKPVIVN